MCWLKPAPPPSVGFMREWSQKEIIVHMSFEQTENELQYCSSTNAGILTLLMSSSYMTIAQSICNSSPHATSSTHCTAMIPGVLWHQVLPNDPWHSTGRTKIQCQDKCFQLNCACKVFASVQCESDRIAPSAFSRAVLQHDRSLLRVRYKLAKQLDQVSYITLSCEHSIVAVERSTLTQGSDHPNPQIPSLSMCWDCVELPFPIDR